MAARFVRLRIAGFKSFAEPATLEILPGLTGVVGPNGCGKSNVAEALRWAMGEANARSLRGGEMDDIIFAGTTTRPSRNLAEVTLTLEGAGGTFPPPFAGQDTVDVVRRIERGVGSAYRVNGREARARDVQTLFADLASGARSSAMVSQGRVSALVSARPEERRLVLEEAAGITGLHARRAEAEGKLRSAEANLARAEERRGQLEAQLSGLRAQAQQAAQYRAVATEVQDAEAGLLSLQRARAEAGVTAAAAALEKAGAAVLHAAATASAAAAQSAADSAALPGLRSAEAGSRRTLDHARLAQDAVQLEAARAREAWDGVEKRRAQVARDLAHAEAAVQDAAGLDTRLTAEAARLDAEAEAYPALLAQAQAEAEAAAAAMHLAETAATEAAERAVRLAAGAQALSQLLAQAEARAGRAGAALSRLRADQARTAQQAIDPARLAAAQQAQAEAEAALAAARAGLDAAERQRAQAAPAAAAAREAQSRAAAAHAKLVAETGALAEVLAVKDNERWPPMVDGMQVPAGLEAALGAALGEELAAAADPAAARHWRDLPPLTAPVPPGQALSALVSGPAALRRALSGIGLVADAAEGSRAQAGLLPGQSLVSRDGAVWRWDGYTVQAGTPTAAAVRLQQRNRLAALRERLDGAETEAAAARAARQAADAAERDAAAAETRTRVALRDAGVRAERARKEAAALHAEAEQAAAHMAALDAQASHLAPEMTDATAALDEARRQHAAAPDPALLRTEAERARTAFTAARSRDAAGARALDALLRAEAARHARRGSIGREREDRRMRATDAASRASDLRARSMDADAEHARLLAAPEAAARHAQQADAACQAAETGHNAARDTLAMAEQRAASSVAGARAAEQALHGAREALVRAEARWEGAEQARVVALAHLQERLGAHPVLPPPPPDLSAAAEDRARAGLQRLMRERDRIGPVNLRAEAESHAVGAAAEAILAEQAELGSAIAKLRGGIGHLNREGRERLTAVFQQVDRHFQALFGRMFGGGRAHLALVGPDDPLLAGLEIYAQPPGKKLAALSLLSGGEQALTALSLIFAVFRCNPAPLCVLDEVDAPLDDANVERFCTLLADMVAETGTRFLVVTHHQLTMARMDRLYGVTMQERGVSRLLSVDLSRAAAMVEAVAAE